jgi:hypothetical protein
MKNIQKITCWTVIMDARYVAWQWTFMFQPTLRDLCDIAEGLDRSPTTDHLLAFLRRAHGTDPVVNEETGCLTYDVDGDVVFICPDKVYGRRPA